MEPGVKALDEKSLGKGLQDARKASGLTQQELCQKAGLSYSTLAKIERGAIKAPSIFTIQNIAQALDTSLDQLLGNPLPGLQTQKKTSASGVKFVYFDVNGCLVRFAHRGFTRLSEASGVPIDEIETIFWDYDDPVCRGDKTLAELNSVLSERINMQVDWKDCFLKAVEPVPDMAELVTWTQENYYTGLLTNIMPGFVSALRQQELIPNTPFDAIIDSSEVHALKPEDAIYAAAEEKAACPASDILLIDDSRTNLIAAKKRGWHTIWFDYYRPAETIQSIRQALEPIN